MLGMDTLVDVYFRDKCIDFKIFSQKLGKFDSG
jgi:hypothetical protein